jgi:uncharacterized protein YyaL (SSP411 family)
MTNRLQGEKSPYLLQHAENPVDWYPWGSDALERARREDKPILLSIGYSACHWCHVMAHESFENPDIAALMNELFVNIKVDREERPDLDAIYMEAVQALSGQGGWPLNVFLMPDGRPFYGGTYFPPVRRYGMPAWPEVLRGVFETYRDRHDDVLHNAAALAAYIRRSQSGAPSEHELSPDLLASAYADLTNQCDRSAGGFGGAPKFPQPLALEFLLRMSRRLARPEAQEFVLFTLRRMASGGIYDQIGGGFHRYTVDGSWVVPHFEKMLYDNALLARVYLQAYQVSHEVFYASVADETLAYLLRDLRSPEGAFFSSEDADSEGEEGRFYVWTPEQVRAVLGDDLADVAALHFGVTPGGNFEAKTILTRSMPAQEIVRLRGLDVARVEGALGRARAQLLEARSRRVRPGTDMKILAGWNGLAIRALAEAGRVLRRPEYLSAAEHAADFVLTALRPSGSLVRSYRDGPSAIPAFLEDYAFLLEALLSLYEVTHDLRWFDEATALAEQMIERFFDREHSLLYDTQEEGDLIVRPRSLFDNPIPSGNSSAVYGLLRLSNLAGDERYAGLAAQIIRGAGDLLWRAPQAFPYLLSAIDFYFGPVTQVAVIGQPGESRHLIHTIFDRYLPNAVIAVGEGERPALLQGRPRVAGKPTAYVCHHFSCQRPVTDAAALAEQLEPQITEVIG